MVDHRYNPPSCLGVVVLGENITSSHMPLLSHLSVKLGELPGCMLSDFNALLGSTGAGGDMLQGWRELSIETGKYGSRHVSTAKSSDQRAEFEKNPGQIFRY